MGYLTDIGRAGLLTEFNAILDSMCKPEAASDLRGVVDAQGLRSDATLKATEHFIYKGTALAGIFAKFSALQRKLALISRDPILEPSPPRKRTPAAAKRARDRARVRKKIFDHLFILRVIDHGPMTLKSMAEAIGATEYKTKLILEKWTHTHWGLAQVTVTRHGADAISLDPIGDWYRDKCTFIRDRYGAAGRFSQFKSRVEGKA